MMLAETLGDYCANLKFDSLPVEVVIAAKLKILDTFACAFAALGTDTAAILETYNSRFGSDGPVPLWGFGRNGSALDAAFGNAVLAHALLHDDTDLESGHVACQIVPAVLAASGHRYGIDRDVDGRDTLAGIVAGYEVMWRGSACGAVVKGSLERSFRGFVINGGLGAAAAAARTLRLNGAEHSAAISCSANAVSGLLEPVGVASIERSVMAGNNSRAGLQGAMLAQCGLQGTPTILEGPQGYFQAVGGSAGLASEAAVRGLGERHRILDTLYKSYPSAGANQSAIYAADVAYRRHKPNSLGIKGIRVVQYPLFGRAVMLSTGKPAYPAIISTGPYHNVEETLPNKPFGVASMLLYGEHNFKAIMRGLEDKALLRLAEKVSSDGDESFGPFDASIEIAMNDGSKISERVDCRDDPRFFPTLDTMAQRFESMCGDYLGSENIHHLIDIVSQLDKHGGGAQLFKFLSSIGNIRPAPARNPGAAK
jgi:2-methylcitrate dehydratase PrpD